MRKSFMILHLLFAVDLPYCAGSIDTRGTECFTCFNTLKNSLKSQIQGLPCKISKYRKLMFNKTITPANRVDLVWK